MEIVCPKCSMTYKIPAEKVPKKNAALKCKKCEHRIPIIVTDQKTESVPEPPVPGAQATRKIAAADHAGPPEALVSAYPQAADYDPARYPLSEILAPNKKGSYKTRLNTLKMKMMDAVKSVSDRLLAPDEQICAVAAGTAYYPLELLFGNGGFTLLYNRYILFCTNKRVLALNTNYRMQRATHYFFQFPLDEIKKVSKGLFGMRLLLTRKVGKRKIFNGIKRVLAKDLVNRITDRITPETPVAPDAELRNNLCPACLKPLPLKLASCPSCKAVFKSPQKAALRSMLLPGLGDIYLGHRLLGSFELIGALFVWLLVLSLLASGRAEDVTVALIFLLFFNGVDSALTLHMGKKGYSLEGKQALQPVSALAHPSSV